VLLASTVHLYYAVKFIIAPVFVMGEKRQNAYLEFLMNYLTTFHE